MRPFQDVPILISGAGRGIGKRLAIGFAAAGARVGLLARSKPELDLAQLEIEHAGGSSVKLMTDVRDAGAVQAAVERMTTILGAPAVLISAHGTMGPIGPAEQSEADAFSDSLLTQVVGSMNLCRAVIPAMRAAHSGKIVLLVGAGAMAPRPRFAAYACSQAALVRLAGTLAEELADASIQVNCMDPGVTYTSLTDDVLRAGDMAGWTELQAAAQIRTSGGTPPDKQLQLAQFLASDRAVHLTGKLVSVSDSLRRLEHSHPRVELHPPLRVQKA